MNLCCCLCQQPQNEDVFFSNIPPGPAIGYSLVDDDESSWGWTDGWRSSAVPFEMEISFECCKKEKGRDMATISLGMFIVTLLFSFFIGSSSFQQQRILIANASSDTRIDSCKDLGIRKPAMMKITKFFHLDDFFLSVSSPASHILRIFNRRATVCIETDGPPVLPWRPRPLRIASCSCHQLFYWLLLDLNAFISI